VTRIVQRPIEVVKIRPDGAPNSFIDRGTTYHVDILLDYWRESGNWIEGEPHRTVFRILTRNHACLDIEEQSGNWTIYRVFE